MQYAQFPWFQEAESLTLSPVLEKVIRVLELTQVDRFIPSSRGFIMHPPQD